MLTLDLPPELEQRLSYWAEKMHCSKSYCMQRAIEDFLDDQEAYLYALDRWEKVEQGESRLISLEDVESKFDLNHDH